MSLLAVLSDIHGNWEALAAVLRDMERRAIKQVICLGDVVGYGADPVRCLECVRDAGWLTLMGNHEEAVVHPQVLQFFSERAVVGVQYSRRQLSEDHIRWIAGLPYVLRSKEFECVHASLFYPTEWNYVVGEEDADHHFLMQESRLAFCGHSHIPGVWRRRNRNSLCRGQAPGYRRLPLPRGEKGQMVVNVGSVGQPRDEDPRSSYVIYDQEKATIQFRRVTYDVETARQKIIAAGLPRVLGDRLRTGN